MITEKPTRAPSSAPSAALFFSPLTVGSDRARAAEARRLAAEFERAA